MTSILYITQDGITDHIGQSQIAPYCMGLAKLGYRIHIVSAEKGGRAVLKRRYREDFDALGIRWSYVPYHNRPPLVGSLLDLVRMRRLAFAISASERPEIVHIRSYLPIEIGVAVKRRFGSKLLIDFRHFWVETGLADKPFKFVYRAFKRREPNYFAQADHVVTLTERAARILHGWYPDRMGPAKYTVIPCCADFDHFDVAAVSDRRLEKLRRQLGLESGTCVLLYLGSLAPDYLLPEMLMLFRELRALRPGAKFLFVANNGRELVEACGAELGIAPDEIIFTSASRDEVPTFLKIADLSVFFYRADLSRAGCSPTKLAELLAANVPVIGNSHVGDLDNLLSPERNGSVVVPDFQPATLRAALEQVLAVTPEKRAQIREASRAFFSLEEGVRRYKAVYERLLEDQCFKPAERIGSAAISGAGASC